MLNDYFAGQNLLTRALQPIALRESHLNVGTDYDYSTKEIMWTLVSSDAVHDYPVVTYRRVRNGTNQYIFREIDYVVDFNAYNKEAYDALVRLRNVEYAEIDSRDGEFQLQNIGPITYVPEFFHDTWWPVWNMEIGIRERVNAPLRENIDTIERATITHRRIGGFL